MDVGSAKDYRPASYGHACTNCARAKCKCFMRLGGSDCERCHRLGKPCQPAESVRKQKSRRQTARGKKRINASPSHLDLSATPERQSISSQTQYLTPDTTETHSEASASQISEALPLRMPNIILNTAASTLQIERSTNPSTSVSPILDDISIHEFTDTQANEQLDMFRTFFIPAFPFVFIPPSMKSSELRRSRPFFWLVIMAVTSKLVSQQFAIANTIWRIISQRIVAQHFADLDTLIGMICFSSWSHIFKEGTPFMTMLTQIAISMSYEMNLHKDVPSTTIPQEKAHLAAMFQPAQQHPRTLEERRAIIALYHLSYSTWAVYRKIEPLRWNSYLDACLKILSEGSETDMDTLLATEVKCQLIMSQIAFPTISGATEIGTQGESSMVAAVLLEQLRNIRDSLPVPIKSERITQFYLYNAETMIREHVLNKPTLRDSVGIAQVQKLIDLEKLLSVTSRWLQLLMEMPLEALAGITEDIFAQFMHCLVVLFKLTILEEPGWDVDEVKRQADVFAIIDHICQGIDSSPGVLGIDDTQGAQRGVRTTALHLLRSVRALFLAEMPLRMHPDYIKGLDAADSVQLAADASVVPDDLWLSLVNEPWLSDMFSGSNALI